MEKEWKKVKPERIPSPTYWPFFAAMGLFIFGAGLITSWMVAVPGFIVFIVAVAFWLKQSFYEE